MTTNVQAAPVGTTAAPAQPAAKTAEPAPKAAKPSPVDQVKATPKQDQAKEPAERKIRVKGYERAAKVKELLDNEPAESASEPAAERPVSDSSTEPEKKAVASAADPDADKLANARIERNKRIAEIQAREDAARQKRAAEAKAKESSGELEKLRKRVAELEPNEAVFGSEEALLEAAEKRGMSPEKLVQWMRTRLSDPSAVAKREAQTVEDRLNAKFEAERKALREERGAFEAAQRQARETAEGQARAKQFVHDASAKADTHPLTSLFLRNRGEQHLVALASAVIVPYLPENYDIENLHDHLEQYLEYVSVGGNPTNPATTSGSPPPKTNGAAKPVTTLSNDLGSRRESVAEDIPLHRLPRSERIARVKRQLGGDA